MAVDLVKDPGEPKEAHESRLSTIEPLFDVHAYVDDFNRGIVPAYQRGTADAGLPSVSEELRATQEDRLANWHTLQELAGVR